MAERCPWQRDIPGSDTCKHASVEHLAIMVMFVGLGLRSDHRLHCQLLR